MSAQCESLSGTGFHTRRPHPVFGIEWFEACIYVYLLETKGHSFILRAVKHRQHNGHVISANNFV